MVHSFQIEAPIIIACAFTGVRVLPVITQVNFIRNINVATGKILGAYKASQIISADC